jgi:hypothetical protein
VPDEFNQQLQTLITPSHIRQDLRTGFFLSSFQTKLLWPFLMFHTCDTLSIHLVLIDVNTIIIFGREYKLSVSYVLYSSDESKLLWNKLQLNWKFEVAAEYLLALYECVHTHTHTHKAV